MVSTDYFYRIRNVAVQKGSKGLYTYVIEKSDMIVILSTIHTIHQQNPFQDYYFVLQEDWIWLTEF